MNRPSQRRLIVLNAPPRVGKDTCADAVLQGFRDGNLHSVATDKFSRLLKERTHALYGMPDLPHDHFEDVKDTPLDEFLGLTPRQAYIAVSERLFKPMHGEAVYGRLLAADVRRRLEAGLQGLVLTDSGFEPELWPLVEEFGGDETLVVRIHWEGEAEKTYAGDSRGYIAPEGIQCIDVINREGQRADFLARMHFIAGHFALTSRIDQLLVDAIDTLPFQPGAVQPGAVSSDFTDIEPAATDLVAARVVNFMP